MKSGASMQHQQVQNPLSFLLYLNKMIKPLYVGLVLDKFKGIFPSPSTEIHFLVNHAES